MGYELEYKQLILYFCVIFIFFFFTGYLITFLILIGIAIAPLEEIDPEEVDDEDELLPFLENTYTRLDFIYFELNFEKIRNIEFDKLKLDFNLKFYSNKELIKDEYFFLQDVYLNLNKLKKKNDIVFLNDIILNEQF